MDEQNFVTVDDAPSGLLPPVESQPQTEAMPPAVSLSEVERIVNEKLQAQAAQHAEDLRMLEQSLGAKAYNRAMKSLAPKLTAIKDMQGDEGWTDADVQQRQQREITKAFASSAVEPEPPAPQQYVPAQGNLYVSVEEITQNMQARGVTDPAVAQKWAGQNRNDTSWLNAYYADVEAARNRSASAGQQRTAQQQQNAQQARQVMQQFGTTATIQPGTPSGTQAAEQRINQLLQFQTTSVTEDNARWAEIEKLQRTLKQSGTWKDEETDWG